MTITLRANKSQALTFTELDGNFTDLDGRVTTLESAPDSDSQTLTLAGDDLTITGGNTVSLSTLSTEVVDDTSPQLGGNLDLNGKEITSSGGSAITEILDVLLLSGGNNGIIMRTKTSAGKIVIGDQAGDIVLGNSSNSVEFVNDVDVDFTNTNIDFTNATITGLSIVQGIDDLSDVDTSTTPPGVGQVLKWDGAQWEPANDSSGSGGATWATLGDKNNASGPLTVALGMTAGLTNQGLTATAIGGAAGSTDQDTGAVAVGYQAGFDNQGVDAVAVGIEIMELEYTDKESDSEDTEKFRLIIEDSELVEQAKRDELANIQELDGIDLNHVINSQKNKLLQDLHITLIKQIKQMHIIQM